jgi:hypothetical protein
MTVMMHVHVTVGQVKPDTLLRWHRRLVAGTRTPPAPPEAPNTEKALTSTVRALPKLVAGAGFEPATSGL